MRHPLLLAAAGSLSVLSACSVNVGHDDGGPRIARNYAVASFTGVEVAGPYEVKIQTGAAPSVRASGSQKSIDNLKVEVNNGILEISPTEHRKWGFSWGRHGGPAELIVTLPSIDSASIAGSGGIDVDKVTSPRFKGEIAGSGDLRLASVDAGEVQLSIAGSGNIHAAAGKAKSVKYEIAGSGDIDAGSLNAETAAVSIAGSGRVKGHATGTAAIEMMGSGDVEMTGGAHCTVSKNGSGDIRCS